MRIYLAGKISRRDWRHDVVDGLENAEFGSTVMNNAIRNRHDYVGPFFTSCEHHWSSHGEQLHGAGVVGYCKNIHQPVVARHEDVWENSITGINLCDVVIAKVQPDAHGTLCEIGYAFGIRKKVILIESDNAECWFAFGFHIGRFDWMQRETIHSALDWCDDRDDYSQFLLACESPAELKFAEALVHSDDTLHNRPVPQFVVSRYRIDFAWPALKLAVEIDGMEFHGNQPAFIADRKRTRFLESQGWRVIRFAAKEVLSKQGATAASDEVWEAVGNRQIELAEVEKQKLALAKWESTRND